MKGIGLKHVSEDTDSSIRNITVFVVLSFVLFLVSCSLNPSEGQLSCRKDSDCPSEWKCNESDKRCYSSENEFPPADGGTDTDTDTCVKSVWSGNYIISNSADLSALSGTTEITGNLDITINDAAADLTGLECLQQVGGHLRVYDDAEVQTLHGLENLVAVGDFLRISHQDNLITITHLESLESIGVDADLRIYNNPLLPTCEAENLRDYLFGQGWEGSWQIYNNDDLGTCD